MQLLITTQTQENYGAHDWDGEGACPQYWKFKGGMDYKYDERSQLEYEGRIAYPATRLTLKETENA